MKILLLNQFFWPDSSATSQLLTDLARELEARGHEVHAVCADRRYALKDSGAAPPVKIHRVKSLPFVRGPLGRVLSYASFFTSSAWKGVTGPKFDLVITLTTPPLLSLVGNLLKLFRGSRHFIWEMDMYPDVAVDLEYVPAGGLFDRIVGTAADFSRRQADGILALGDCMRERLIRRGIATDKIHVAENWADGSVIQPVARAAKDGRLVLLYSGNLGLAHDVDTLAGAIDGFRDDPQFQFIFAGSGPRRQKLEQWCGEQEIKTVEFRPYSQRANLGESLGAGDVGLVTQRDSCIGSVVPSKVYGLLAAARPILFVGPRTATPAQIINRFQCGWQVDCGDVAGLMVLLRKLAADRALVKAAGERAREAFVEHYDLPLGVSRICSLVGADAVPGPTASLELSASRS